MQSFETLVDTATLHARLGDPSWRVFDCRFSLDDPEAGRREYAASHIPGALHADIDLHLSGPRVPGVTGRHPLPDRAAWIRTVQSFALDPTRQVVVYDDAGGAFAARLWWMLRWIGHEKVAVLDGGWRAWRHQGFAVTDEVPAVTPTGPATADYAQRKPLTRLIDAASIDSARQRLVDARGRPRFRGDVEPIDPVAGHIPGAVCAPASDNLDSEGFFKPPAALAARFDPLRDPGRDIVCYCGSGITAAHNLLAMKIAGLGEPFLYAGSWSEWITDPRRGIATGG